LSGWSHYSAGWQQEVRLAAGSRITWLGSRITRFGGVSRLLQGGWLPLPGSSPVLGACSRVAAGQGRQGAGRHKSGAAGSPPTLEQPAGRTFDSTLWCTLLAHPAGWCALGREVPPPPCRPAPQSVPRGRWGATFGGVGEPGPSLRLFPTSTCVLALGPWPCPPSHPGPVRGQERVTNRKNNG